MNQPQAPDPLGELRDIHLPEPIPHWPPAIGWWILSALVLAAMIGGLLKLFKYFRSQRHIKQATLDLELAFQQITAIDEAHRSDNDLRQYLNTVNNLLKRITQIDYPDQHISALVGRDWLQFLNKTGQTNKFTHGAGQILAYGPYEQTIQVDIKALQLLAQYWIKKHRRYD